MCVTFQINVIVCDCPIDCLRQEVLLRVRLLPDGEQERNQETQADRQTGTGTDQKIIVNWEFVKTFDSTPSLRLNLSLPLFCQTGWRRLRLWHLRCRLCIYLPFFRHAVNCSPSNRHMAQDKAKYQSFNPGPSGKTVR